MVEYDPRILDEWRRKGIIKERGRTIQVTKKRECHTCVTLRVPWQNLVELSHMCGLVCLSISSLLTAAKEKTLQEQPFNATISHKILNNISIC